jgi:hypothetical protein
MGPICQGDEGRAREGDDATPGDPASHEGKMINRLEVALAAWRALTKHERAQFLSLHNEFYDRKRAAAVGSNPRRGAGGRKLSLTELTATEADLEAAMARHSLG